MKRRKMNTKHATKCDQCDYLFINGIGCHEYGCPNRSAFVCQCGEFTRHAFYANDWDGIKLCEECAKRQTEYEAELECLEEIKK